MKAGRAIIVCFGEVLWDVLPDGIFPGGAPMNVAYHLSRHGVRTRVVSAVGRDFLGDEILRRAAAWGLDTRAVARHARLPTGTVRATLDRRGGASYRIEEKVAWDRIPIPKRNPAGRAAGIVFGTLALRELPNRQTLDALLFAQPGALPVLDINLRPPFDRPAVVSFALRRARIVKLNDRELGQLSGRSLRGTAAIERAARRLADECGISGVCVTAGARGAGLLWERSWNWEHARRINVQDTVGAGDAFLAALLASMVVRQSEPRVALRHACRIGEFVAARPGATPPYVCDEDGNPREQTR